MLRSRGALLVLLLVTSSGCARDLALRRVSATTAKDPATPYVPSTAPRAAPAPPLPVIPEELLRPGATVSLPQVVILALRNNPATRIAWAQARSAAANLGQKRAAFFPSVEVDLGVTRQKVAALGGQVQILQTTWGPSAALNWVLFDLGGRSGDVEEALRALEAADFGHDAAVQNVILAVEQAWYRYLNAKAQASAAEASLRSAEVDAEAAEDRHQAGVATIADVLQARTLLSRARLDRETAAGAVQTIRGALATALGLPATIPVEAGELPQVDVSATMEAIDALVARAEESRPDLAAARLAAEKARAHAKAVRGAGLPSVAGSATAGRTYYPGYPDAASRAFTDVWAGSLVLRVPLFGGLSTTYETLKAEEDARVAAEQAESYRQQVVLQVYTSYYELKTAAQRVLTSRDLLASATQNEDVARERYKAGVGSILDLVTAESGLASARAQEAQARADWLLAVARLAHDTGVLTPPALSKEER